MSFITVSLSVWFLLGAHLTFGQPNEVSTAATTTNSASSSMCGGRLCTENEICKLSTDIKADECVCKDGYRRGAANQCERSSNTVTASTPEKQQDAIPFQIEGPTTVHLPKNTFNLTIVLTAQSQSVPLNYTYYWEVLEGGGYGTANTYTEPEIILSGLKEGVMRLRATVSNDTAKSYQDVSVTVLSEDKPNKPPVAVIRPSSPIHAVEGSRVVIDAEGSLDEEDSRLLFEWKLLQGPAFSLPAMNTAILRLDDLKPGNYSFGLTVKDQAGASDQSTVEVMVSAKRDDPPKAQITQCGDQLSRSTIDVRLPTKTLFLCANASSDDFGITSYKWFRMDELITKLAVDFSGSSTSVLTLTNLQPNEQFGPYIFKLEVKDGSGQSDSATVNILVNKAVNQPPEPDAGGNQTIQLPATSAVLNGNVKDDGEIVYYEWTQLSGPTQVTIVNGDKSKCTISGFVEGVYEFRFNVTDDGGLVAFDDTFVNVVRIKNEPPVARAYNVTVHLPSNVAVLNGTESTDDAGIVRYLWMAHDDVPACIVFLGSSANEPVALLGGLVEGEFDFDLTVMDHSNEKSIVTVTLTVIAGEQQLNSVELYLWYEMYDITHRLRNKLGGRLGTALAVHIPEALKVDVHFSGFAQDPTSGRLRVVFFTDFVKSNLHGTQRRDSLKDEIPSVVVSAPTAVSILRNEVNMIREFHIDTINTLYCTRDCSGHGQCSNFSKECECDRYWMPSLFEYLMTGSRLDCSWSILYFGLTISLTCVFLVACITVRCKYSSSLTPWRNAKRAFSRRQRRRKSRNMNNSNAKEPNSSYSLLMRSDSLSSECDVERRVENASNRAILEQNGVALRERPAFGVHISESSHSSIQ